MTDEQKLLVGNYSILVDAESKLAPLIAEEEERQEQLEELKKTYSYQLINHDTEVEITGYNQYQNGSTEIVILSEIDGKPVTSIGNNAFDSCNILTSVHENISMYTAGVATARRNEIFIGYKLMKQNGEFEVVTNPKKDVQIKFSERDCFIVLAED